MTLPAPFRRMACNAQSPTGPAPTTTTVSLSLSGVRLAACTPMETVSISAAWAKLTLRAGARRSSRARTTYSAMAPCWR